MHLEPLTHFNFRCLKCAGDKHRHGCKTRWRCSNVLLQVVCFVFRFVLNINYQMLNYLKELLNMQFFIGERWGWVSIINTLSALTEMCPLDPVSNTKNWNVAQINLVFFSQLFSDLNHNLTLSLESILLRQSSCLTAANFAYLLDFKKGLLKYIFFNELKFFGIGTKTMVLKVWYWHGYWKHYRDIQPEIYRFSPVLVTFLVFLANQRLTLLIWNFREGSVVFWNVEEKTVKTTTVYLIMCNISLQ